jgi:hypothetical protein
MSQLRFWLQFAALNKVWLRPLGRVAAWRQDPHPLPPELHHRVGHLWELRSFPSRLPEAPSLALSFFGSDSLLEFSEADLELHLGQEDQHSMGGDVYSHY